MAAMLGPERFAFEIGFRVQRLQRIAGAIEHFYHQTLIAKTYDDGSPQILPSGEIDYRKITESKRVLKIIQRKIQKKYLSRLSWPDYVHGGIKGRSNKTNAARHKGKKYHFLTDIRSFFPSISHHQVYAAFNSLGFAPDTARLATLLTTYQGCLPQGAPTSPHLANLVFSPIDAEITALCLERSIVYTRYIDDLVFSSSLDFKSLAQEIIDIISSNGFKISNRKKTYYKIGPVEITGIVTTNNALWVPDETRKKLARLAPNTLQYQGLNGYIEYVEAN